MTNVLITGANGFIGKALCAALIADACNAENSGIRAAVRAAAVTCDGIIPVVVGNIDATTDWTEALQAVDVVVHLAARVHVMRDGAAEPLAEFRKTNVDGTMNLARQAAQAGARRFIFISSIKVNGEFSLPGRPFTAEDNPGPVGPYAISKYEAEQALRGFTDKTTMDFVIIRPPLIYGPGVKANFYNMMRWLDKKIPLPLGAIDNRRSLLALDNLVDLISICIKHPAAANQIFLAADGEDMSTAQLLQRVAAALGKTAFLIPVPMWLLTAVARMCDKTVVAQRLCSSLQVDIGKAQRLLGWIPPVSVKDALAKTAQDYMTDH
ncbi:MAG: NAD-dependent epimerase/dehydratase family protein [Methylovulum sp.]|nr:NAD-dependent epimerase/dehydratase family protein [Methylovulum sp.]